MLRISTAPGSNGQRRLKVEGWVAGEFVNELWRVAHEAMAHSTVALDLADVTFVDHSGARALRMLKDAGVELVGSSEFVLALMQGEQS